MENHKFVTLVSTTAAMRDDVERKRLVEAIFESRNNGGVFEFRARSIISGDVLVRLEQHCVLSISKEIPFRFKLVPELLDSLRRIRVSKEGFFTGSSLSYPHVV